MGQALQSRSGSGLIRILDVSLAELESELVGRGLDSPTSAQSSPDSGEDYVLEVRGWVIGRRLPVKSVQIFQDGRRLWHGAPEIERPDVAAAHEGVPGAGSCGFYASVAAVALDTEFEVQVRAILEDKTRVEIATIRGRRAPIRTSFEPQLKPLMITTLGRTGSSALIRVLDAHPEIVAYRPFQYEPRVGTYWIGVLKALSEPASYRRQIEPAGRLDADWWLGREGRVPARVADDELDRWLGIESVETLAAFCQGRIDGLYRQIADWAGKAHATYFAEKFRPDPVASLMRELYPQGRELIVARDFRDMASSMLAFNEKRGVEGFRRDRAATDVEYIEKNVKNSAGALAKAWQKRSDTSHLVRYEDFVQRPSETLEGVLTYLGLDATEATVDAMLTSAAEPYSPAEAHKTADSADSSIGRWRRDLSPEMQQACDAVLGPALETFGYA
jgi:hypothetical protein